MKMYEPAMCYTTALCGVGVDSELLRMGVLLNTLKGISNSLLKTKASSEVEWINRVENYTNSKFAVIA